MANEAVLNNVRLRIESALSAARQAADLDHPELTGTVREILVRELVRPLLPPGIGVGRGKVIDHLGGQSGEIDIVIYDRALLPPLLYGGTDDVGLFPVEACVYALQVKSTSSLSHLRDDVLVKGRSLAGLTYLQEACGVNGEPLRPPITAYFAFDTDLKRPPGGQRVPEIERWESADVIGTQKQDVVLDGAWHTIDLPALRVLCVVGQGYGYYNHSGYTYYPASSDRNEVTLFVAGLANTLFQHSHQRSPMAFGHYLVHD